MAQKSNGPPDRTPRLIEAGDDWWPGRETLDVIVPDDPAGVDTGLLDQFGEPIRRHLTRHPVGFCR